MTRILTIILLLFATPAWAEIEQPNYAVILEKDRFAIRDYASVVVVETEVVSSRREASGDAFRSLFRYISGNNEANLEISMTSPVAQTLANQNDDDSAERWIVRFFRQAIWLKKIYPCPVKRALRLKAKGPTISQCVLGGAK